MQELNLILKDNEVLNIDGKYNIYNIKTLPNSMITINEYNSNDYIINLELGTDSNVKYMAISLKDGSVKRSIKVNKNAYLEFDFISIAQMNDTTTIDLNEEYGNVKVNNLCISNLTGQIINTTINHNAKNTKSSINNIGVSFDEANILFNTIGFVANKNSGCDCRQLSKGVIVGEKSKITSKPILLIDEYDVKAYHGATIGKMSDDELFYLMSRGLSKKEAFLLMLDGLISPTVSKIKEDSLREEIQRNISILLGD